MPPTRAISSRLPEFPIMWAGSLLRPMTSLWVGNGKRFPTEMFTSSADFRSAPIWCRVIRSRACFLKYRLIRQANQGRVIFAFRLIISGCIFQTDQVKFLFPNQEGMIPLATLYWVGSLILIPSSVGPYIIRWLP